MEKYFSKGWPHTLAQTLLKEWHKDLPAACSHFGNEMELYWKSFGNAPRN